MPFPAIARRVEDTSHETSCVSVKLYCFKEQGNVNMTAKKGMKAEHTRTRNHKTGNPTTKCRRKVAQPDLGHDCFPDCFQLLVLFTQSLQRSDNYPKANLNVMATWVERPSSLLLDRETVNNGLGSQFNQTGGKGATMHISTKLRTCIGYCKCS